MDFDFSEDQRLLKDSVDRLIADRYAFESRKQYMKEPTGWSAEMWAQYAELGLLGLPFTEEQGGFGGGQIETAQVMEAFGRGQVLEPYLATVVLGGGLLRHAGSEEQQAELIPQIIGGELKLALAHIERHSRWTLNDVAVTAVKDGSGWVLNGEKSVVIHGDCADKLLVTARTGGSQRDRGGIGVFLVDANDAGVSRKGYPTQDGLRAAEISFANARGVAVGDPGDGLGVVERVVDEAIAAICSEAVGGMAEMLAITVDYMKQRKQFGRAIGEFQVLQHRAVDMFANLEQAKSMAMYATMMAASDNPAERRQALSAAKVQIGKSGKSIGEEAVQLHGGIAMTMEYKVGHYFKRMTMIEQMFGSTDHHLAVLADGNGLF
ncbi:MAG: acyl-CoA dehydrogenase family protein [Alphaproteobacteria bacterium]|nr:acyl-CoA dehydrogenase family protein [Alphaproteobacteria bacterium]